MSEQQKVDGLLRQVLSATPAPRLSSTFERRLSSRMKPARLDHSGRLVLAIYSAIALLGSVWVMRVESMGWTVVVISILLPLIVVGIVYRRSIRTTLSFARPPMSLS
jgi:hypothetical protein